MDNIHRKSLRLLNKYFRENSRVFIKNEINEISKLNVEGVSFEKYIQSFNANFKIDIDNFNVDFVDNWETTFESNLSEKIEKQKGLDSSIVYHYENQENNSFNNDPDNNDPEYNLAA